MSKKDLLPHAFLRLFHCNPLPISIDLYIDGRKIEKDILYQDFTKYIAIFPGEHTIQITEQNVTDNLLIEKTIFLEDQHIYTMIMVPETKAGTGYLLYLISDVIRPIPENKCMIRFGQFSRSCPTIEATLSTKTPISRKAACYEMTYYLPLLPDIYTITLKDLSTQNIILTCENLILKPYRFYTLYIIGALTDDYPLQYVLSIDGNSHLHFPKNI